MCCSPYDNAYVYQGGAWQRDNLCEGRVGSAFFPAGTKVIDDETPPAGDAAGPPAKGLESIQPAHETPAKKPKATSAPTRSVKKQRVQIPRPTHE